MLSRCFRGVGRCVLLSLVGWLTACGGGGGGGGTVPSSGATTPTPTPILASADEYLPLNSGDRRAYLAGTDDTTMVSVIGPQQLASGQGLLVRSVRRGGWAEEIYQRDTNGVRSFPGASADLLTTTVGPLLVMKPTFAAGDRWIVADATVSNLIYVDEDTVPEVVTVRVDATVVGMESLTVGSSSYTRVAHIQTVGTRSTKLSRTGTTLVMTVTSDDWYAPGIGLVRSRVTTVDGSLPPTTRSSDLTSWHVGNQRSDVTAPAIASKFPLPGMTLSGCCLYVSANFDRAMDIAPSGEPLKLTGPDGQPVAGTSGWQWDGKSVSFSPTKRLTTGTYTAAITTANRDVAGNALSAEVSWQFNIDATGPTITPVQPLPKAQDVPIDSKIVFTVEADTDLSSLTRLNVEVTTFPFSIDVDMSVSGHTVTLTPRSPLPRAAHVRVRVLNLLDQQGNRSEWSWEFDTDAGRFAAPQALTTVTVTANAIGDLDGDGRNDVVLALPADPDTGAGPKVQVFMGQPGGGFSSARSFATAAGYLRNITSLVLVDVDRNGSLAIVAGNDVDVLQVLRRQPDGQYAVSQVIDTASAYLLRVADFNGDGRADLIGRPYNGNELQIWLQGADGRFVAGRAVALQSLGGRPGFAVGDLNGDGRLDIVVSNGSSGITFSIAYQQADGSFAPAVQVGAAVGYWREGMAIGDVNGDGRQDLILAGVSSDPGTVMLQDAKGQLLPGVEQPGGAGASRINVADIDGDGRLDVVASGYGTPVYVMLQRSDGSLGASQSFPVPDIFGVAPSIVAIGDLDGDGRPDILYGGYWLRQRAVPAPAGSNVPGSGPSWLGLGQLLRAR